MSIKNQQKKYLLVGNPNVGKSTIFNILCQENQKTGNYSGVTVEGKKGDFIHRDARFCILDLPGAYSIYPTSVDEEITSKILLAQEGIDGIIYVADATNLRRSLLFFQQIHDLGLPMLLVINLIDEARKKGDQLDTQEIEKSLGVKVICTNARHQQGIAPLKEAIYHQEFHHLPALYQCPQDHQHSWKEVCHQCDLDGYCSWMALASVRKKVFSEPIAQKLENIQKNANIIPKRLQIQEIIMRYKTIDSLISRTRTQRQSTFVFTQKLDHYLTHPILGYLCFLLILLGMFQSVYFLAQFPMEAISWGFDALAALAEETLPKGPLNSLISNGIISGVGAVMVFIPQIAILLGFIAILEDSGYMARAVYLMDRFLKIFGLSGKSIIPMISGMACAVPAILASRNIEHPKERLMTILITPFMTCSARLPVFSVMIALVIPDEYGYGLSYRAIALMGMYTVGVVMTLLSALLLKYTVKVNLRSYLILDLPTYKIPIFSHNAKAVSRNIKDFILGTGKIILAVNCLVWALGYCGTNMKIDPETGESNIRIENSYLASMGKAIEPAIAPLGYDWKIGVSLITSFAAREAFVGTMKTLYSLDEEEQEKSLVERMNADVHEDGTPVYTLATGCSILFFYAFAMQCISTIAVVYRETKSLFWTLSQLAFMSGLAYIVAFLVYQFLK